MIRIYGTLGPACDDMDTLGAMFRAGMTGIRVNLSHTSLEKTGEKLLAMAEIARENGVEPDILIDMQGPELRVGNLREPAELKQGDSIVLGKNGIPVPERLLPCLVKGSELLLDDGKILVTVTEAAGDEATVTVRRGGTLRSRKSIALEGTDIDTPAVTESDRENLGMAEQCGVTGVMQPFVRRRGDLDEVRAVLKESGAGGIRIFAKIENMTGVRNLPEIIDASDEIVIARGDLGNAMPLWELPRTQKEIARSCRSAGRDFMVVTQMLNSMEQSPVPTRAEVSDIFNAVLDGASSLMVTGETAVGKYPVRVIEYLVKTMQAAVEYRSRD